MRERIERELAILQEGGQEVVFLEGPQPCVLYRAVPTRGTPLGLPETTDVIVPVPSGYPGAVIDLAGLPVDSPLLPHLAGGTNNQGRVELDGRQWQLASYHPHTNGGGPLWNPSRHGFHTYMDHIIAWLANLN
jgi:hypothetical protein